MRSVADLSQQPSGRAINAKFQAGLPLALQTKLVHWPTSKNSRTKMVCRVGVYRTSLCTYGSQERKYVRIMCLAMAMNSSPVSSACEVHSKIILIAPPDHRPILAVQVLTHGQSSLLDCSRHYWTRASSKAAPQPATMTLPTMTAPRVHPARVGCPGDSTPVAMRTCAQPFRHRRRGTMVVAAAPVVDRRGVLLAGAGPASTWTLPSL